MVSSIPAPEATFAPSFEGYDKPIVRPLSDDSYHDDPSDEDVTEH